MGIKKSSDKSEQTIKVVGITVGVGVLLLGLIILFVWNKKRMDRVLKEKIEHRGTNELMLFSYKRQISLCLPCGLDNVQITTLFMFKNNPQTPLVCGLICTFNTHYQTTYIDL